MAMRSGPYSELEDGLPLWRIQVDDPQAAMDAPLRLFVRVLPLPLGSVAAMALELSDVKGGRPSYHHVCGAWSHPDLQVWFTALRWAGKVRLRFEHAGWMSDAHRDVDVEPVAPAVSGTERDADTAVREYAAFYREQFPRLKSPVAVWEACLEQAERPAATVGTSWKKWAWAVGLIVAAALAAWLAF